jgi:phage FluMu protein gp41
MTTIDKRWDGLTESGVLAVGVYFAGTRHKSFTLRVPMAGDLVGAQQEHPQGPLQLITVDVFRRQLLALGDIPVESLTTELLLEELTETDLARLGQADEVLEKKLAPPSAVPTTGDASSTPLSDTAIA